MDTVIYQQDRAITHCSSASLENLHPYFSYEHPWLAHFPDLSPLDYFLLEYLKHRVSMLTIHKLFVRSRVTFERRSGEFSMRCWTGSLQTSMCESSHSDSAPRSLDRAHYKLLSCARKMVVYEEKPDTTQYLHICKTGLWKRIAKYSFQYKMLFYQKRIHLCFVFSLTFLIFICKQNLRRPL